MVIDSILPTLAEQRRQDRLNDRDFTEIRTYLFELIVPSTISPDKDRYLFPLALPPEDLSLSEPFAVAQRQTLGGGLFVEENGIVQRTLNIKGHFGVKPKPFGADDLSTITLKEKPSYSSKRPSIPTTSDASTKLSGKRHFQFLQRLFRIYGDAKRNPETAEGVELRFHDVYSAEHWQVVPLQFTMSDTKSNRIFSTYDIELLVVGPVEFKVIELDSKKNLLEKAIDTFNAVRSGIDQVQAGVRDVLGVVNQLNRVINTIEDTILDVLSIADTATDFVNGVTRFIDTPFRAVRRIRNKWDSIVKDLEEAGNEFNAAASQFGGGGGAASPVPDEVLKATRQIRQGLELIVANPEAFEQPNRVTFQEFGEFEEFSVGRSEAELNAASARGPFQNFNEMSNSGTGLTPGSRNVADSELNIGRFIQDYPTAFEYEVKAGDSIQSISEKFLGDVARWRFIAVINKLEAPFISDTGVHGSKRIGDTILVPLRAQPQNQSEEVITLGLEPTEDISVRSYGRDMAIRFKNQEQFDFAINGNRDDFELVEGIPNVEQALRVRTLVEVDTYNLYNIGISSLLGKKRTQANVEQAILRIIEAVEQDPRVVTILSVQSSNKLDAVVIDMNVLLINQSTTLVQIPLLFS